MITIFMNCVCMTMKIRKLQIKVKLFQLCGNPINQLGKHSELLLEIMFGDFSFR